MAISFFLGILIISFLGFFLGFGLAFAAKIFHVKIDENVEKIIKLLPGVNCGGCGYQGCAVYAEAIVKKGEEINLCAPGGQKVIDEIGLILGKKSNEKIRYVAKIQCLGDDAIAIKDYKFNGEEDCYAVSNFFGGEKACKYGCIGKGNCIRVCPVNAIKRDKLNRVWIDSNECIGCEKCLTVCPTKIIKMFPIDGGYFIACSSPEAGKKVKEICKKGCIGCKICEKITGDPDRIIVADNLAKISYNSKTDLKSAALKCPADVIVPIKNQKLYMKNNKENKTEA